MARGGGGRGRRTYVRDGNGRFASTPGGGASKPKATGGTLGARSSLRRSRAKLAAKDPADRTISGTLSRRSQKGAVTRGQRALAASRQANRVQLKGALPKGAVRLGRKKAEGVKPAPEARPATRLDGDAFAARLKRARGTSLRRSINESDRENALSGAQRRAVAPGKRFAASNQRQARAERTAAAARAFYDAYGSPSVFGSRPRQTTASSPSFGSKRRGRRAAKPAKPAAATKPAPTPPAKPAPAKPAPTPASKKRPRGSAPKKGPREISTDKAERIISRVMKLRDGRPLGKGRKGQVQSRNTIDTENRAREFLNKLAGLVPLKKYEPGMPSASNVKQLTREQMIANLAQGLAKLPIKRTSRNRSKDVERRQQIRANARAAAAATVPRSYRMFGRAPQSTGVDFIPGRVRQITESERKALDPKGRRSGNAYTKLRRRRSGEPLSGPHLVAGGEWAKEVVVMPKNKQYRTRTTARRAHSARVAAVGRLAGTARLGGPVSYVRRGRARQRTLTGGTATTYGRFRTARTRR